ncbi:CHAT domain-containing protein [Candidatus Protochlamydia sp. W-9]|uniref:CHAT domain-containing protein n=1 Tax=Candidatus Protochlamydia sp. W-9 TaxID=1785087 RepID=UPI00096A3883|nr:CHAT domain-containing tetratricopeptide repeat protein [Candidatus Protochlamydia sp. W-9]
MNVRSVESSISYNSLFFQSSPIISTLDQVKGLIEAYKTKFTTEENIIINAKLLIEKINQLKDIGVKRECFCRLLILEVEEIQGLIVQEIMPLFDFETFLYDIQHNQAQQLIYLEEIIREIIESKLKSKEINFIVFTCMVYQDILEHLWLLPYLEFGNHCFNLLTQNKDTILNKIQPWIESLYQLANEKKIEFFIPKNVENSVLRFFEPLPEDVAKEIEEQKSVIHKRGEMTSRILEIMMKVCSDQGDFPRAIFHAGILLEILIQKPSEISQEKEVRIIIMQIHENLADWNQIVRQNERAISHGKKAYQKALKILPQDNFLLAIKIHENLAGLFNNFGRYGTAIFHAEKILELTHHPLVQINELETLESSFSALKVLGNIYGTIGNYGKELDYQKQALEIAEKLESLETVEKLDTFSDFLEIAYMNLGNAYCHVGNYSESAKYYVKALKIVKEPLTRAKILVNLGNILFLFGGRFVEAIGYYKKANKIDNQIIKKQSLNGLGLSYAAMGKKRKAIQCLENFICLSQKSEDRRSEAIGYTNLGKLHRKSDPKLAEENYQKSINIYASLYQELKNHSQGQITFFEEQAIPLLRLESILLEQGRIEEALQTTDFRRSRALVSALTKKFQFQKDNSLSSSGLTIQEMQALANKLNTCFIIYSFVSESKDNITVWVIPPQGEIICQSLPLGNLTEELEGTAKVFQTFPFIAEARTIETPLSSFLEELTRGEPGKNMHLSNLQSFKERLSLWYEALIAPLESYLPEDPQQVVTIIPDGFLSQIPFAAFLDKEGTYLIEKHPLSIAPSIGILKLLDEIPKDFSENSLVIGNPTTPHIEDTLPFAEKEAQTIVAPLLKTTREKILLQDSATAQRILEGMRDARWIHLACHGSTGAKPEEKLDPHSVFEGLFKLAPEQENPNGYLHAQEIASLILRTELVFMSACFSGRGKLHREGSVGPVWSFLAAGALSTVATYWRLPDSDLTIQMVETFYRHLLGIEMEKLNKAQALQKAMLVGIEKARERPDRWGAFFLSGLYK